MPTKVPQNPPDMAPAAVVLSSWLSLTLPSSCLTAPRAWSASVLTEDSWVGPRILLYGLPGSSAFAVRQVKRQLTPEGV
jgi:hypothetical protein